MQRLVISLLLAACSDSSKSDELAAKLEAAQRETAQLRAQLAAKQAEIDGRMLPEAARHIVDGPSIAVRVGPKTLEIDGKAVAQDELEKRFRAAFASDPRTHVIVQQDKDTLHGRLLTVLEAAKAAGLTHFSIQ